MIFLITYINIHTNKREAARKERDQARDEKHEYCATISCHMVCDYERCGDK